MPYKDPITRANYKKTYQKLNRSKILSYQKKYRVDNKNRLLELKKIYYIKNKPLLNLKSKKWREENPEKVREVQLKTNFGISLTDYNEIYKKQKGVCKICGKNEVMSRKGKVVKLSVDHCHNTSRIRGLLCNRCNKGLGNFNDNPKLLSSAIKYLKSKIDD